jgi:uncharacterized membrane protein YgdD (TMEM256/DUF423 family)
MKKLLVIGSILGASAVILGAFGAHALKTILTESQLESYQTGVHYQIIHAIVIIIIGILYHLTKNRNFITAANLMFAGAMFFSFSIYLLSLRDFLGMPQLSFLGPVTPIGGILMIIGWIIILINAVKLKND